VARDLVVVSIIILVKLLLRDDRYRYGWDKVKLGFPIIGELLRKQAVSRFAVTFSTLLKSGIPALQALGIVRNVLDNLVLKRVVQEVHDRISKARTSRRR